MSPKAQGTNTDDKLVADHVPCLVAEQRSCEEDALTAVDRVEQPLVQLI